MVTKSSWKSVVKRGNTRVTKSGGGGRPTKTTFTTSVKSGPTRITKSKSGVATRTTVRTTKRSGPSVFSVISSFFGGVKKKK